jgi:hypothetical protein
MPHDELGDERFPAISQLEEKIDKLRKKTEDRLALDAGAFRSNECRDLDLAVCLAGRQAFTELADYTTPDDIGSTMRCVVESLRDALTEARQVLDSSKYVDADKFRSSLEEKSDLVTGVLGGQSLEELLESLLCA